MAKLDQILSKATEIGASDVHISVNNPPLFRLLGELKKFKTQPFSEVLTKALLFEILTPEMKEKLQKDLQCDFSYEIPSVARYRANVFWQRLGLDGSFRIIPFRIPTLEELGLPKVVRTILEYHQGLILVTGATGHGKSTTLASMVDYLNETKPHHILSIEDPIEFVQSVNKKGVVNQRQVGRDTLSFPNALRGALREDPDIIIIGELRDPETISLALTAAETGHLVIGTMSTSNAQKTVDRLIDSFPPEQQNQVRTMLADSIKGVVTQRLIKDKEGKKRVLAAEIMVGTVPVATIIRDSKTFQIPSLIQTGKKVGMQLMDESLMQLLKAGLISPEAAASNATNKKRFLSGSQVDIHT
jgi:twitching motility protein PilT